jgi:hypothetical protein
MKKIYKVTLTADECSGLTQLVSKGKSNAQKIKHTLILLAVEETELEIHYRRRTRKTQKTLSTKLDSLR